VRVRFMIKEKSPIDKAISGATANDRLGEL